jgi:hypothetical protein
MKTGQRQLFCVPYSIVENSTMQVCLRCTVSRPLSDNPKPISENLIAILRSTLQEVEETSELSQDHPVMVELKRTLTRALSDLEAIQNGHPTPKPQSS